MSNRTRDKITSFFTALEADVVYIPDFDSELHEIIFSVLDPKVVRIIGDHNPGRANSTMEWSKVPAKAERNKKFIAAAKISDAVHVVNPPLAEFYAKSLKKTILPIPNALSITTSLRANPSSSRKVIVIGRFATEKCIPDAIEAFTRASKECPEWTMHIYGEGAEKENIEAALAQSSAGDRIKMLEPTPAILERMAESAIHLSASAMESFGLTLAEALAIGCPVVARDHPGSRFLLSGGRGVIAEDKSIESLTLALKKTMDDVVNNEPTLQSRIYQGQQFVAALTPDHIGQQWHRYIRDLVNKKFN